MIPVQEIKNEEIIMANVVKWLVLSLIAGALTGGLIGNTADKAAAIPQITNFLRSFSENFSHTAKADVKPAPI